MKNNLREISNVMKSNIIEIVILFVDKEQRYVDDSRLCNGIWQKHR